MNKSEQQGEPYPRSFTRFDVDGKLACQQLLDFQCRFIASGRAFALKLLSGSLGLKLEKKLSNCAIKLGERSAGFGKGSEANPDDKIYRCYQNF